MLHVKVHIAYRDITIWLEDAWFTTDTILMEQLAYRWTYSCLNLVGKYLKSHIDPTIPGDEIQIKTY